MARFDVDKPLIMVTLSRRNLLALLHKLDLPGSARMITSGNGFRGGRPIHDVLLVLRVEDDDEHYAKRAEPPGGMHPDTEEFIGQRAEPGEDQAS